jgi:hypothetical protein
MPLPKYEGGVVMSEQEMMNEIERLTRELEAANKSRDRLREMLCVILPMDSPEVTEKLVLEMMQQPVHGIEDIIADLLREEPDGSQTSRPIPA